MGQMTSYMTFGYILCISMPQNHYIDVKPADGRVFTSSGRTQLNKNNKPQNANQQIKHTSKEREKPGEIDNNKN